MSAEVLRRAAVLMRERAEAARAGRWFIEGDEVRADWTLVRQVATCHGSIDVGNVANAEHIAGMQPRVALAVADWLDGVALFVEAKDDEEYFDLDGDPIAAEDTHAIGSALTVARAYLGESA